MSRHLGHNRYVLTPEAAERAGVPVDTIVYATPGRDPSVAMLYDAMSGAEIGPVDESALRPVPLGCSGAR